MRRSCTAAMLVLTLAVGMVVGSGPAWAVEKRVIGITMAGGVGSRLYPLSRALYPKQLLRLPPGEAPMIFQATHRVEDVGHKLGAKTHNLIAANAAIEGATRKTLEGHIPKHHQLFEPVGRNSSGAVFLGAMLTAHKWGPDTPVVVLTADHYINPRKEIVRTLAAGVELVNTSEHADKLVTIGIPWPATHKQFGHMVPGKQLSESYQGLEMFRLDGFKEKPDLAESQRLIAEHRALVNSGMFVGRAGTIVEMFATYEQQVRRNPEFAGKLGETWFASQSDAPWETGPLAEAARVWATGDYQGFVGLLNANFHQLPSLQLDHAIAETGAADGRVVGVRSPENMTWRDLGSPKAVEQTMRESSGVSAGVVAPHYIDVRAVDGAGDSMVWAPEPGAGTERSPVLVFNQVSGVHVNREGSRLIIEGGSVLSPKEGGALEVFDGRHMTRETHRTGAGLADGAAAVGNLGNNVRIGPELRGVTEVVMNNTPDLRVLVSPEDGTGQPVISISSKDLVVEKLQPFLGEDLH